MLELYSVPPAKSPPASPSTSSSPPSSKSTRKTQKSSSQPEAKTKIQSQNLSKTTPKTIPSAKTSSSPSPKPKKSHRHSQAFQSPFKSKNKPAPSQTTTQTKPQEISPPASPTSISSSSFDTSTSQTSEASPLTSTTSPLHSNLLSPELLQYLQDYQLDATYQNQHREKFLDVDDLSLTVGQAYEKIRKVIDWKEDNALRRGAIFRALKRCLIGQIYGVDRREIKATEVNERLLMELMRTGYFNNDLIGVQEAEQFTQILAKYIAIISYNQSQSPDKQTAKKDRQAKKNLKRRMKFQTWILEIAACEIENCLAPNLKAAALTKFMITAMTERIKVQSQPPLDPLFEKIQLELAVRRSLNAEDNPALCFSVIKHRYDFWTKNTAAARDQIIAQIDQIYTQVNQDLNDKIGQKFRQLTDRYDAAYRLIGDMQTDLDQKQNLTPPEILDFWTNPEKTSALLNTAYQARRQSLKGRLIRSSIWSTLSILLANGVSIILLEGPIASLMGYEFNWLSIAADLLLPSLLMFILVIIIRLPTEKNYTIVEKEVQKIIYNSGEIDTYRLKIKPKPLPKPITWFFNIMYLACALAALYVIYQALAFFGLPPTSVYLNIVYIAMVFFAGLAIKDKSQEITIQERVNFGDFLLQLFSIPLDRIGSWFSNKWKEYNIVAILFSVIVDTPFSALITMISDWRNYLQERASEI